MILLLYGFLFGSSSFFEPLVKNKFQNLFEFVYSGLENTRMSLRYWKEASVSRTGRRAEEFLDDETILKDNKSLIFLRLICYCCLAKVGIGI